MWLPEIRDISVYVITHRKEKEIKMCIKRNYFTYNKIRNEDFINVINLKFCVSSRDGHSVNSCAVTKGKDHR